MFILALGADIPEPHVWGDEDELVLEWISPPHSHAIVSFEGDGMLGYTMLIGKNFIPGHEEGAAAYTPPEDLKAYLSSL